MPDDVLWVVRIMEDIAIVILVRDMSVTFYHHTDNKVDGEVQGVHDDDANAGMNVADCSSSESK